MGKICKFLSRQSETISGAGGGMIFNAKEFACCSSAVVAVVRFLSLSCKSPPLFFYNKSCSLSGRKTRCDASSAHRSTCRCCGGAEVWRSGYMKLRQSEAPTRLVVKLCVSLSSGKRKQKRKRAAEFPRSTLEKLFSQWSLQPHIIHAWVVLGMKLNLFLLLLVEQPWSIREEVAIKGNDDAL